MQNLPWREMAKWGVVYLIVVSVVGATAISMGWLGEAGTEWLTRIAGIGIVAVFGGVIARTARAASLRACVPRQVAPGLTSRSWRRRQAEVPHAQACHVPTPNPSRNAPSRFSPAGRGWPQGGRWPTAGSTGAAWSFTPAAWTSRGRARNGAILKQADLNPLDISGYGTLDERLAEGHDIDDEERALMARALAENSVVVAQMTPFFDTAKGSA